MRKKFCNGKYPKSFMCTSCHKSIELLDSLLLHVIFTEKCGGPGKIVCSCGFSINKRAEYHLHTGCEFKSAKRDQIFENLNRESIRYKCVFENEEYEEGQPDFHSNQSLENQGDELERDEPDLCGYNCGDELESILNVRKNEKGMLEFYCCWKFKNICSFVPGRICHQRDPLKVIEYYENILTFETTSGYYEENSLQNLKSPFEDIYSIGMEMGAFK